MVKPEKRGSKHGIVVVTFSHDPLKHQFQFIDQPGKPIVIATDIYAAANQIEEKGNNA